MTLPDPSAAEPCAPASPIGTPSAFVACQAVVRVSENDSRCGYKRCGQDREAVIHDPHVYWGGHDFVAPAVPASIEGATP